MVESPVSKETLQLVSGWVWELASRRKGRKKMFHNSKVLFNTCCEGKKNHEKTILCYDMDQGNVFLFTEDATSTLFMQDLFFFFFAHFRFSNTVRSRTVKYVS